jgi:prepilin-type N-terminal cleavage/methylation domain-containing protein
MKHAAGFTLLELLVVIFIAGLLTRAGTVAIGAIVDAYQLNYTINQLQSDIAKLRSHALATGCSQTLEILTDGSTYSGRTSTSCFSGDYDLDDLSSFTHSTASTIRLAVASPIELNPRGFLVDSLGQPSQVTVSFLCRGTPCTTKLLSSIGVFQ